MDKPGNAVKFEKKEAILFMGLAILLYVFYKLLQLVCTFCCLPA